MYQVGDILSLTCGKVRMVVSGHGNPLDESKTSVNVYWEEFGVVRSGYINLKCLKPAPKELEESVEHQTTPASSNSVKGSRKNTEQ